MSETEMIMPKMGESVAEATILKWLKNEGDKVDMDEAVLEIATDKVDSEIPSPVSGILSKKFFEEGKVVQVGTVIALISTKDSVVVNSSPTVELKESISPSLSETISEAPVNTAPHIEKISGDRFYSPLIRNIAKQENIKMEVLENIPGTGENGRLTKKDLLQFIEKGHQTSVTTESNIEIPKPVINTSSRPETPKIFESSGNVEIIEMDRMRKLIAEHMVMSKHTSPHVSSFVEVDVTAIVDWRNKIKASFEARENEKITFTPVFIEAVAHAIKDFPMINISVDGSRILVKKDINIGMATALPNGNLIVPVIKQADRMNLLGLTKAVNQLASKARSNKLSPDDIQGGTFTITNVGTFGNVMGTPIINQPQVAILATGVIRKKPAVIETPQGDFIGIRSMMFLSLSYDHRVVDGSLGGSFLRRIADYLENFDTNRLI
jgi:2-oxoglutarate dehydrogenase E2 component (dihydrolipoamide succinyltransferase)